MSQTGTLSASLLALVAGGCLQTYGDAIVAGTPPPPNRLVSDQLAPQPLVVFGGYVYWINNDPSLGSVLRVPVGGGPAETLADRLATDALVFAVDGAVVYFPSRTGVMALPVGGGVVTLLASSVTHAVGTDATNVYWCEALGDGHGGLSVNAMPKTGGASQQVAALPGFDPVTGFVVQNGQLYVSGALQHAVARVPVSGGSPVFLDVDGRSIASDGQTLFFAVPEQGSIGALAVAGGTPQTLAAGLAVPDALAVDDSHVYFSVGGEPPWVARLPKKGGALERLAATHGQPRGVAVDTQSVYFTDAADGIVGQLPK